MNFLASGFLVAGALAAIAVFGLHFLTTRDRKLELFPTARFIPDTPSAATATKIKPSDFWLLLIRLLIVGAISVALARPVLTPPRRALARIVAVDVSRAVQTRTEAADSAQRYRPAAAAFILFDSVAKVVTRQAIDSLHTVRSSSGAYEARGSLSAAIITALREAARLRDTADSLELVVVSPFMFEEFDAATLHIRKLWPGRITTVQVAGAVASEERRDSIRVEWADSVRSPHWVARDVPDTIAGVRAADAVMVHPFVRRWELKAPEDGAGYIYARWADGEPAAFEYATAAGCVRTIGFSLPKRGDALLRADFQRFLQGIKTRCGEPRNDAPVSAPILAALRGTESLAAAANIARRTERATPLTPWLLAAAAVLGLIETLVRNRRKRNLA